MTQPQAAIQTAAQAAPVRYQPKSPVSNIATLRSLVDQQMASIAAVLPRHVTPERITKTLFVAVNRTPQLLECEQATVLESLMRAAELGLDVSGTLGDAYLVPFRNQGRMQCQLIIGYRGKVRLMRQSGEVASVDAAVVHEHDHFVFEKGLEQKLEHRPNLGERGKVIGVWAMGRLKDGSTQFDFLPVSEVERIRSFAKSANSPAWRDHWGEMAKKTALNRLSKLMPMSSERYSRAVAIEEEEFDLSRANAMPDAPMLTAAMLGVDSPPDVAPVIDLEPATKAQLPEPQPVPLISPEAVTRVEDAASARGMTPDELEDLIGRELGGLALAECEPNHEVVILSAISKWKRAK